MDNLKPLLPFSFKGNISQSWKSWKKAFNFFLVATETEEKASTLLTCIGSKGRDVYKTFTFAEDGDKMKLAPLIKKFDEYCEPRKNTTIRRHRFLTHKQSHVDTFTDFVTELKSLSDDCELGELRSSLVQDVIICGVNDKHLLERLLREDNPELEKVIKIGQAAEQTKTYVKQFKGDQNVDYIVSSGHQTEQTKTYAKQVKGDKIADYLGSSGHQTDKLMLIKNCKFCGCTHNRGNCPAYGKECNHCKKKNHFANVCLSRKVVNEIQDSSENSRDDDFFIDSIHAIDNYDELCDNYSTEHINKLMRNKKDSVTLYETVMSVNYNSTSMWSKVLKVCGKYIEFKIDTGSQVNILPKKNFEELRPKPQISNTAVTLSAYNNTTVPVHGKCICFVEFDSKKIPVLFIITDDNFFTDSWFTYVGRVTIN